MWLDGADLFSDQLRSLPAREALLMSHDSPVWCGGRKEGGSGQQDGRTNGPAAVGEEELRDGTLGDSCETEMRCRDHSRDTHGEW